MEEYASFVELCAVCDERKVNNEIVDNSWHEPVREKNDIDVTWTDGVKSYDEAKKYLLYGRDKHFDAMAKTIQNISDKGERHVPRPFSDVTGCVPIVPNAILGLPNSMINYKRKAKKQKVITLLVDNGVACSVDARDVADWGAKTVGGIMQLEKQGYRVRIDAVKTFNVSTNNGLFHHVLRVPVKNENQPLDVKRICFPIAEAGFPRLICFDWYERLPNYKYDSGYGRSMSVLLPDERKKAEELFLKSNEYYVCYGDSLEDKLKEVK